MSRGLDKSHGNIVLGILVEESYISIVVHPIPGSEVDINIEGEVGFMHDLTNGVGSPCLGKVEQLVDHALTVGL